VPRSMRLHKERIAKSTPKRQAGVLVVRRHRIGLFNSEKGRSRRNRRRFGQLGYRSRSIEHDAAQATKTFESFGGTR
jgi:hypothetical protein